MNMLDYNVTIAYVAICHVIWLASNLRRLLNLALLAKTLRKTMRL